MRLAFILYKTCPCCSLHSKIAVLSPMLWSSPARCLALCTFSASNCLLCILLHSIVFSGSNFLSNTAVCRVFAIWPISAACSHLYCIASLELCSFAG